MQALTKSSYKEKSNKEIEEDSISGTQESKIIN